MRIFKQLILRASASRALCPWDLRRRVYFSLLSQKGPNHLRPWYRCRRRGADALLGDQTKRAHLNRCFYGKIETYQIFTVIQVIMQTIAAVDAVQTRCDFGGHSQEEISRCFRSPVHAHFF